jgi:hypothetical protein
MASTPSTLVHLRLDEPNDAVRPSDLIGSLQDLLPAAGAYPTTAALAATAFGYGTWVDGLLCDEASGNLVAAFGGGMNAVASGGSPSYGAAGPLRGTDKAVTISVAGTGFEAASTATGDIGTGESYALFAVIRTSAVTGADSYVFSKVDFVGGPGFYVRIGTDMSIFAKFSDTVHDAAAKTAANAVTANDWTLVGVAFDRTTNRMRVGARSLTTGATVISNEVDISAIGALSNTSPFRICRSGTLTSTISVAALYHTHGVGFAGGLSANMATALANFAKHALALMPPVVDAFTGRGRQFSAGYALDAADVVAGASLATRDTTVRAILSWDLTTQAAYGLPGTIVARGKGGSAAEFLAYGLELRVVNATTRIGEVRFIWQDTAGNLKTQLGGQFIVPSSGFFMLTAVRRWVSATQVELRYYAGGQLIGEFLSSDGDIGGGTMGTFTLGARSDTNGLGRYLCGVIDELQVFNYEITAEETAATWDRMARLQPRGYRAIRDLMQPGAPVSNDPTSRIQKLLRIIGHGIGYAAAQVENFRQNLLPDRAYGSALARWEGIMRESPKPTDSIATRRERVVAHFRQRSGAVINGVRASGVSVPAVQNALAGLLALAPSQLQVIALDQTIRDDFSAGLKTTRWMVNPSPQWTIAANALRLQAASAASLPFDGTNRSWYTCLANVGGNRANPNLNISTARYDGIGVRFLAKLAPTAIPTNGEVGVVFYDLALGNALLFGIRNNGGTYQLITETFRKWVSQGVTVQATTALVAHWLQLKPSSTANALLPQGDALFAPAWSTTSSTAGYTNTPDIQHAREFHWMGMYARSWGGVALGGALDVSFDDVIMRSPSSARSLRFYAYRDPTLPGAPDLVAAELALQRLKQAHTEAHVTQSLAFKATDPYSQAGRTPTTY